jgi:DNA-directed RNA polymerase subunit K/omega
MDDDMDYEEPTIELVDQETPEFNSQEFSDNYETMKLSYKTPSRLNKYEMTRVLAERANQISNGCPIMVEKPDNITDSYGIAVLELKFKKIPFIIKRPYGNTYEYWKLKDLH